MLGEYILLWYLKETEIINLAIAEDSRISDKENYRLLKEEIARMLTMRRVSVIPVVGTLGAPTTKLKKHVKESRIDVKAEQVPKHCSARDS